MKLDKRTKVTAALFALALFGLSLYLFVANGPPLILSLRSLSWPETEATVLDVKLYERSRFSQQRMVTTRYMDFRFRYQVDGREFVGSRVKVKYYPSLGDPALRTGDTFSTPYDPNDPAQTVYQRRIYHYSVRLVLGLLCLVGGLFFSLPFWPTKSTSTDDATAA
ncbi:MAG: DUF3592 domain-containing protein [Acidobacteriota bacterium]